MLKVKRAANGETVFSISGRMGAENIGEVKTMLSAEASGSRIVLDLKDLTLVDHDVVSFLSRCESAGIQFENCPAYIREWINVQRQNRGRSLFPDAQ